MAALLFGSISTLADTSELQRSAFNQAFAEHGLDWTWGQEEYRSLLGSNGGADRVTAYAQQRGEQVDAVAVHATKSRIFQASLATSSPLARPGVEATLRGARDAGLSLALVTTTSAENVAALLDALGLKETDFDVVTSKTDDEPGKPDPAVYRRALDRLGVAPADAVSVEDNPGGVASSVAAGVTCLAFPNENTGALDFGAARATVRELALDDVRAALP